jgi:hypothetical protein
LAYAPGDLEIVAIRLTPSALVKRASLGLAYDFFISAPQVHRGFGVRSDFASAVMRICRRQWELWQTYKLVIDFAGLVVIVAVISFFDSVTSIGSPGYLRRHRIPVECKHGGYQNTIPR